jgi:hypothetical protein
MNQRRFRSQSHFQIGESRRHTGDIFTPRQIEHGASGGHRAESYTPLDCKPDRFRKLEFASGGPRHVSARVEDALVELPAIHAEQGVWSRRHNLLGAGFSTMPASVPSGAMEEREGRDSLGRNPARPHELVAPRREDGALERCMARSTSTG